MSNVYVVCLNEISNELCPLMATRDRASKHLFRYSVLPVPSRKVPSYRTCGRLAYCLQKGVFFHHRMCKINDVAPRKVILTVWSQSIP